MAVSFADPNIKDWEDCNFPPTSQLGKRNGQSQKTTWEENHSVTWIQVPTNLGRCARNVFFNFISTNGEPNKYITVLKLGVPAH